MAALLTSVLDNSDKVAGYIDDCKRNGIKILPPNVNFSFKHFTVANDNKKSIMFGLLAIKNLGHDFIDTIINNAGFGDFGKFSELDLQKQTDMVQVNIMSVMQLCHLFVNPMLEKNCGKILNVASIAAFIPGPLMSTYHATKAFVLSFSDVPGFTGDFVGSEFDFFL